MSIRRSALICVGLIGLCLTVPGCLTRTQGPGLPYVKPAQSVPDVDPVRAHIASRLESLESELSELRDQLERLQAQSVHSPEITALRKRVAFIERELGIKAPPEAAAESLPSTPAPAPPALQTDPDSLPPAPTPPAPIDEEVPRTSSSVPPTAPPEPLRLDGADLQTVPPGRVRITNDPIEPDERMFRDAYALVRQGDLEQAASVFEQLVKEYPKSRHAANAVYWIGEALLEQKRFKEAIIRFDSVIKDYPGSKKEVSAHLKLGQAFAKMGDEESARLIFDKLIREHPHTAQARIAKSQMKNLSPRPAE